MNLYLVSRTDNVGYDEFDAFVVAARDSIAARDIVVDFVKDRGVEGTDAWMRIDVTVEQIGQATANREAGIVLDSFNAG